MNSSENPSSVSPSRIRPLSPKQERRLVVFLDNEFLELTRGYKKRFVTRSPMFFTSSCAKDLGTRPSNSTNRSIDKPGYPPNSDNLPIAMDWLDDLDQSWVAVLQAQVWNPNERVGEDLVVDED